MMLMDNFKLPDLENLVKFIKRLSPEFQVIFFRGIVARDRSIRRERIYADSTKHLMRFLNDDEDEQPTAVAA